MKFKIIAAVDNQYGIGKANTLPWYIKKDLKDFSKTTIGNETNMVVMGSKTWESIPIRPLKKRINVVLTRSKPHVDNTVVFLNTVDDICNHAKLLNIDTCWVIGGAQIYSLFLENLFPIETPPSPTFNAPEFANVPS